MAAPEPDRRCPRCGTPYEEAQEYCLECGSRLPAAGGVIAFLGSAWRRRLGWYPGDWIWPALLALAIAGAAGAASSLWLADRSNAGDTVVATSPQASSVQTTATAPEPTRTATGPPTPDESHRRSRERAKASLAMPLRSRAGFAGAAFTLELTGEQTL